MQWFRYHGRGVNQGEWSETAPYSGLGGGSVSAIGPGYSFGEIGIRLRKRPLQFCEHRVDAVGFLHIIKERNFPLERE